MDCWNYSGNYIALWNNYSIKIIWILSWFGNFLNFLIFVYIAINVVNTACFDIFQMSFSLIGLTASIFVQIVSIIAKY